VAYGAASKSSAVPGASTTGSVSRECLHKAYDLIRPLPKNDRLRWPKLEFAALVHDNPCHENDSRHFCAGADHHCW
jgi:hypothetical protein